MSYNLDYVEHALSPFGGMTRDMLKLLKAMKTEKFICVQTLGTERSIYILRGQENDDDFSVGVENVMAVGPLVVKDEEMESTGKNHEELAKALDKAVIKHIIKYAEDCEELPMDTRQGLSPSVRSAGLALSSKLMRLSRLAVMGNKQIIRKAAATISPNLATIACNIDDIIVFNAGNNSFDGAIFFIPLSLDKRGGKMTLKYHIVTDEPARNFIKLIEGFEPEELTLGSDLPESEAEFIQNIKKDSSTV